MKERGGVMTTITLLIAAVLGVSYMPRKAADSGGAQEAQRPVVRSSAKGAAGQDQAAAKEKPIAPCEQIAKRLKRFYPATETATPPASCFPTGAPATKPSAQKTAPNLNFAIAFVPNPVQTHLPLVFDRAIESVQQAAQDLNYSYDGSWFPWNHSEKAYESLSDEEQAAKLEADLQQQPGVMVFRRGLNSDGVASTFSSCEKAPGTGVVDPNCAKLDASVLDAPFSQDLVVFVVAEQPTGGINDTQFEHALEWMKALQPTPSNQQLLMIGPTFSGSLPSLARELNQQSLEPYVKGMTIYSGGTNSETSVRWFQLYLAKLQHDLQPHGLQGDLRFRTFFEGDTLMTDRFLCYLQHEGYNLDRVAILSEDETAFGKAIATTNAKGAGPSRCRSAEPDQEKQSPIYLYYPRDIAALRSAYEQQSIFGGGKPQGNTPSSELRGNLSEPVSSEHDTVRTYGGQLTPLAQESMLFSITNILDSKRIEFIVLRSSNSLDQLFLSEFLRRSYPSGRVVIDGSDVLFRRGMQGASLRGVMLLSPYPLLSWTQDSIDPIHGGRRSSYRVFAEDLSEATYIAARELFELLPEATQGVPISDYAPPKSAQGGSADKPADKRPATWVTVVGHRQFWPIAVLNEETEIDSSDDAARPDYGPAGTSLLNPEDAHSNPQRGAHGRLGLPGEMTALLTFCVLLALWHLYCCAKGSIIRSPRVRAYFVPIPRVQHPSLIFIGGLLLGLLGVTVSFAITFANSVLAPRWIAGIIFAVVAITLSGFLGCVTNYRLPVVSGEIKKSVLDRIQRWRRIYVWAWIPALAVLALLRHFYLTHHLTIANQFPAFWRGLYLRSGVSPLMPQVVLIAGLYAWFWFNLQGLALFGDDRPVLPGVDELPLMEVAAKRGEDEPKEPTRTVKVFRMFSQEGSATNIEYNALPLGHRYLKSVLFLLPVAILTMWVALGEAHLRSLGDRRFGTVIFFALALCVGLILADALQLLNTWSQLRQLLIFLDRLRLRRTLGELKGLYGGGVWKLSGNVLEERYRLISRQFESARNLQNSLASWTVQNPQEAQNKQVAIAQMNECALQGTKFATWYVDLLDDEVKDKGKSHDIRPLAEFQKMLATTAGCIMKNVILPEWQTETQSLISCRTPPEKGKDGGAGTSSVPAHICAAEEFFVLPYLGFIQNTLGRVRTIAFSIVSLFIAATIGVSSYPFDPLPVIGAVFLILFALVGATMIFTYGEMCRDATLSHIANTTPGELGMEFWVKMAAFGIGPLIGLLTTLFPSMTDFVVSFLQPGAQAFK